MGRVTTTYSDAPQPGLTIDALKELYRAFRSKPIVIAVWCVDRPDALWRVRELVKKDAPADLPIVAQVPVYDWYSRYADEADWARRPECFKTPGVYMQMSDGIYISVAM